MAYIDIVKMKIKCSGPRPVPQPIERIQTLCRMFQFSSMQFEVYDELHFKRPNQALRRGNEQYNSIYLADPKLGHRRLDSLIISDNNGPFSDASWQ